MNKRLTATPAPSFEVSSLLDGWSWPLQSVEACHLLKMDTMEGIEGYDKSILAACYVA